MNLKNMGALVAGLVVSVILLAAVLVPVISEATETEKTFTNDGYFRATHYDDTTDHTLTWTYEKPTVVTVDNVEVPINYNVANGSVSVVIDTNFIIRLFMDANGSVSSIAYIGSTGGTKTATVADEQTATFTFTSGTMTATVGAAEVSGSYTDLYLPTLNGAFVMKAFDKDAYIHADSDLVAYGLTRIRASGGLVGAPGIGFSFTGSYEDGVTGSIWRDPLSATTVSNETVNVTEKSKYIDLYTLQSITATATFTETVDEETVTTDTVLTYNYLLVPYEVTAELSQHMSTTEISLIEIVPLLVTVGIIIGIIGMAFSRRE